VAFCIIRFIRRTTFFASSVVASGAVVGLFSSARFDLKVGFLPILIFVIITITQLPILSIGVFGPLLLSIVLLTAAKQRVAYRRRVALFANKEKVVPARSVALQDSLLYALWLVNGLYLVSSFHSPYPTPLGAHNVSMSSQALVLVVSLHLSPSLELSVLGALTCKRSPPFILRLHSERSSHRIFAVSLVLPSLALAIFSPYLPVGQQ